MKFNSDFKYDLELGQEGENLIAKLLSDSTIEVKLDFIAWRTDNIFIEYESRGKPSGIYATTSDYWFHRLELKDKEFCTLIHWDLKDLEAKTKIISNLIKIEKPK